MLCEVLTKKLQPHCVYILKKYLFKKNFMFINEKSLNIITIMIFMLKILRFFASYPQTL